MTKSKEYSDFEEYVTPTEYDQFEVIGDRIALLGISEEQMEKDLLIYNKILNQIYALMLEEYSSEYPIFQSLGNIDIKEIKKDFISFNFTKNDQSKLKDVINSIVKGVLIKLLSK